MTVASLLEEAKTFRRDDPVTPRNPFFYNDVSATKRGKDTSTLGESGWCSVSVNIDVLYLTGLKRGKNGRGQHKGRQSIQKR